MTEQAFKMREQALKRKEESWTREKELIKREQVLAQEKQEFKPRKKKITTTKLIVLFIFINCSVIEIYSMWVMYKLMDLSALYTLITAVVGESITFITYAAKSTKENSVGGIVYDSAMNSMTAPESDSPNENGAG